MVEITTFLGIKDRNGYRLKQLTAVYILLARHLGCKEKEKVKRGQFLEKLLEFSLSLFHPVDSYRKLFRNFCTSFTEYTQKM